MSVQSLPVSPPDVLPFVFESEVVDVEFDVLLVAVVDTFEVVSPPRDAPLVDIPEVDVVEPPSAPSSSWPSSSGSPRSSSAGEDVPSSFSPVGGIVQASENRDSEPTIKGEHVRIGESSTRSREKTKLGGRTCIEAVQRNEPWPDRLAMKRRLGGKSAS